MIIYMGVQAELQQSLLFFRQQVTRVNLPYVFLNLANLYQISKSLATKPTKTNA